MTTRSVIGSLILTLGAATLVPVVAAGQEVEVRTTVLGRVVDRTTGAPLAGAFVKPPAPYRGSLTDETGRFQLSLPPGKDHPLHIERLGYAPLDFVLAAGEMGMSLRVELDPQAILLEGIEVFSESLSEQFERRLNSRRGVVRGFGTREILEVDAHDGFEFFDQVFRMGRPCSGRVGWCAYTPRGEVPIRACIDGQPAWGGVEELRDYRPEELYRIEVDQEGRFVRAYTWRWVRSGFRQAMTQMDPIVRMSPDAPRSAAVTAMQEAYQGCG
jgi:hypothetical protein